VYLTGGRDLSDGIFAHWVFLIPVMWGLQGTLVDGSPIEVRHYEVADKPANNCTIAVFTLWWTPRCAPEFTYPARASLQ
jgi:hypothetical protein